MERDVCLAEIHDPKWQNILPRHRTYLNVKMLIDWVLAVLLLLVLSPLLLLLAAGVKLTSRGPIFYTQTRLGLNGRLYRMFKLRTMVHNAEAGCGPVWAARNDVRVTSFGRFLRDTHLDELPQLWNILVGDMSLIGPRPERPEIASTIARELPQFYLRLRVRPGITGLAQMLLPADDPEDRQFNGVRTKLANDLVYVREVGIGLDLRITVSTACHFAGVILNKCSRGLLQAQKVSATAEELVAE
ncbi:MAG TPA: sugar transferase [Tepidisphaeraceae bacterium]|nr:sugar transferase [Tepidisphaeraceae bacterium]